MPSSIVDLDVTETTTHLANFIRQKYAENTSGMLKGYLVSDEKQGVISQEERKIYFALGTKEVLSPYHGSVKCSETGYLTRSLTAMIIAYAVRNNLMELFRDYPFKKFEIKLETYPKYRYEKNRFWKYRKTGDDLCFLKIDMEW